MTERALIFGVDAPTSGILRPLLVEAGLEVTQLDPESRGFARPSSCAVAFVGARVAERVSDLFEPGAPVTIVLVAAREDIALAAAALREGAHDCLFAPVAEPEFARAAIRRALERERLTVAARDLAADLERQREQLDSVGVELAELANRDPLTGVHNRRYLLEAVEQELARARRHGHPFSLVALELEGLGDYNEAYGRLAGEELLRAVARLLEKRCRAATTLARFGGGEFVMLLPEVSADGAASFACALRDALVEHVFPGPAHVGLSVGVAGFPEAGEEAPVLIERVEQALARAGREGSNRVALWTPFASLAG